VGVVVPFTGTAVVDVVGLDVMFAVVGGLGDVCVSFEVAGTAVGVEFVGKGMTVVFKLTVADSLLADPEIELLVTDVVVTFVLLPTLV